MSWALIGIFIVIASYVIQKNSDQRRASRASMSQVRDLPLTVDQARQYVEGILSKKDDRISITLRGPDVRVPEMLGPITSHFFDNYEDVTMQGLQLSIRQIAPSEYARGFVSIGHDEDWDVVQRPGEDEVLVLEGGEVVEGVTNVRYPTVYHLILENSKMSQI